MFASMNLFEIIPQKIVCPVQEREVKGKKYTNVGSSAVRSRGNKVKWESSWLLLYPGEETLQYNIKYL